MKSKLHKKLTNLLLFSFFLVLTFTLTFVPSLGYIQVGSVSLTTVHLPVIIGAFLLGPIFGSLLGLAFGLGSLIMAFLTGSYNLPFTNPLLSVVPRVLLGFLVGLFSLIFQTKDRIYSRLRFGYSILGIGFIYVFVSALIISLLYYFVKYDFYFKKEECPFYLPDVKEAFLSKKILPFVLGVLISNTLLETTLALFIAPVIIKVVSIIRERSYDY